MLSLFQNFLALLLFLRTKQSEQIPMRIDRMITDGNSGIVGVGEGVFVAVEVGLGVDIGEVVVVGVGFAVGVVVGDGVVVGVEVEVGVSVGLGI